MLEWDTFAGFFHLALGKGNRIGQEKGPIVIKFKDFHKMQRKLETYLQIDGEFFKVVNPDKVVVRLSQEYGHLKILKNIMDD